MAPRPGRSRNGRATNLSSLYFHWQSKENLYLAVYRQLFQELTALAQEVTDLLEDGLHARKRLEEVIDPVTDRIFTFFDANRELARLNLHRVLRGRRLGNTNRRGDSKILSITPSRAVIND